jgi:hypothetical protein
MLSIYTQMDAWNIKEIIDSMPCYEYYFKAVKKFDTFTKTTHWRYFTFLHLVGAEIHQPQSVSMALLEQFENGKFYSTATVRAMETKYLKRIVEAVSVKGCNLHEAAKTIAFRATLVRQSSRSTRQGKIVNH